MIFCGSPCHQRIVDVVIVEGRLLERRIIEEVPHFDLISVDTFVLARACNTIVHRLARCQIVRSSFIYGTLYGFIIL